MDGLVSLIDILRQTESVYARLLGLMEDESRAVIASDMDRLLAAGVEKQNLIGQLGELDRQRLRALQLIGRELNVPSESLTVSGLAARVHSPYAEQLRQVQQRLNTVMEKVRHSNEQCRMLISHCLRLVQNSLGFFQHRMDSAHSYGAAGDLRNTRSDNGRLLSGCV
jgi:flagellar biosynthesis/type III secretory pathway chaperone